MSWKIKGEFIESCSCNMLCPCWYGVKELMIMDEGWCASPWLIRIGEGGSEDVDLSGCNVVLAMFFPGPTLLDGGGTGRLYLDKASSQAQRRALEGIFTGKRGGPMEVPDALLSTWLPTRTTDIDVSEVDGGVDATVGEYGRIVSRRLINEQGDPVTMKNAGFALVWQFEDRITNLAPSHGSLWSDPDLPVSWTGKSGAIGRFTWGGH